MVKKNNASNDDADDPFGIAVDGLHGRSFFDIFRRFIL
jgi:hypothetical protein